MKTGTIDVNGRKDPNENVNLIPSLSLSNNKSKRTKENKNSRAMIQKLTIQNENSKNTPTRTHGRWRAAGGTRTGGAKKTKDNKSHLLKQKTLATSGESTIRPTR